MLFEQLHLSPLISQAVKAKGYKTPTPIQQQAIPIILSGSDLIGKAPTGTGKTAAFMLPALHKIAESKNRQKPQVLVLTPTRELASQITNVIYDYGKELQIKPISLLGGMPYREQQRKLAKPHDIIVATPGRLIDYINNNNLDLSHISMLILDEADRMLDMGFIEDVEFIASKVSKKRQTLLFTATMDKRLITLSQHILHSPQMVEVKNENVTLDAISQRIHLANDAEHKFKLLQHLLTSENIFKAIIFSATKRNADKLSKSLTQSGHQASALHGDMNQRKRNKTITDFRSGKIQFLIATDVAARGIDINDISHVINYDLPRDAEDYVHRIGRTGRAGRDGIAISFVLSSDHANLQKIERFTRQVIPQNIIKGLEPKTQTKGHSGKNSRNNSYSQKRSFGSKSKQSFRGGSEKRSFGDKPKRSFGGNSERNSERSFGDKPKRNFGSDRFEKRSFNDKPKRSFGGNSERNSERSFSDRPKRSFRDNTERSSERNSDRNFGDRFEKRSFGDKPKRSFGGNSERNSERSFSDRSEKRSFGDKPKRSFGERSEKRSFGDKPKKSFGGNRDFIKKDFSKDSKKPFKKSFKKDKA